MVPASADPLEVAGTAVVLPSGVEVVVGVGETLMAAAQRAGLRWPTVCGGQGACTVCVVRVLEGGASVLPAAKNETERLAEVGQTDPCCRMACQLKIAGDVRVEKRGVRPQKAPAPAPAPS